MQADPSLNLPSVETWFHDNLAVILIVAASILIPAGVLIWHFLRQSPHKKTKRKRHSHRRKPNPTLAQTGGLPPVRELASAAKPDAAPPASKSPSDAA